jgi:hypothetical protein
MFLLYLHLSGDFRFQVNRAALDQKHMPEMGLPENTDDLLIAFHDQTIGVRHQS